MRILKALVLATGPVFAGVQAAAQTDAPSPGLQQRLELPAHRALARTRASAELAPFTTDGCSGGMSASWDLAARLFEPFETLHGRTPPWEECCVIHDRAYHLAGPDPTPEVSYTARLEADEALRHCVRDQANARLEDLAEAYQLAPQTVLDGYAAISDAMFHAVRTGGGPCSGLPWRWGYGYPNCLATPADMFQSDSAGPENAPAPE